MGQYPDFVWASSEFQFEKLETGDSDPSYSEADLVDAFDLWTVSADDPVVESYAILQNYPNPFNPSTTVSFYIPDTMPVKLMVYNVQGQLVADLVDDIIHEGSHEVVFDASQLPSGIYFCRMIAGDASTVKKMMFLK